jgi:sulfatase maturation enzyme AslB (radical SAM superfamily)
MPEDQTFQPNPELMQDNELALLTRLFASLGFDKIRLIGGEPTVRVHIVDVMRSIASTEGIRSVSMTTNRVLLKKLAQPLEEAGLQRVNISIDTLNAEKFQRLPRWGKFEDVLEGMLASEKTRLDPYQTQRCSGQRPTMRRMLLILHVLRSTTCGRCASLKRGPFRCNRCTNRSGHYGYADPGANPIGTGTIGKIQ